MPLPDYFDSPLHLPFNSASLNGRFYPSPDGDPGGDGVLVQLCGQDLMVEWAGDEPRLPFGGPIPESIFIGLWDGKPCRVLSLNTPPPPGSTAESLLATDPRLSIELLSLGGIAVQTLHWDKNSRRCTRCGCENEQIPGERGKKCTGCGYAHYPHIHPCVIVLVRRRGEVLLTRKAEWPEGRYSLVAGFLDIGECLEEAVAREVREETGVEIRDIRYVGSQNWPFPSQLMAGFTAEYVSGDVRIEEKELEDARWFATDALPTLPPRRSIARYILDHHLKTEK